MIPHKCMVKSSSEGDCMRACLATVLDLDSVSRIPNFAEGLRNDEEFLLKINIWLGTLGLSLFYFHVSASVGGVKEIVQTVQETCPETPCILIGKSAGGVNHAVVVADGEIYNDPSGAGISQPCDDGTFIVCSVAISKSYGLKARERNGLYS